MGLTPQHTLKIKDKYWKRIYSGEKTFEVRKNDRDFQKGDLVQFVVIDRVDQKELYSVQSFKTPLYRITYVLTNCPEVDLGDLVVFGLTDEISNPSQ